MEWKETGGGDYEQPEPGTYAAVCYRIIDLGTQHSEFQGEAHDRHQCLLSFELDEKMGDGRPFSVSKFYTTSLHEKANLRKDLSNWRGRDFTPEELHGFDPKNVLGKPCMLSIIKNDKGKTRIASISKIPKGMTPPAPINPQVFFTLQSKSLDPVFETFSDGIKKIIMQSPEYVALINRKDSAPSGPTFNELADDIPFRDPYAGRMWQVV